MAIWSSMGREVVGRLAEALADFGGLFIVEYGFFGWPGNRAVLARGLTCRMRRMYLPTYQTDSGRAGMTASRLSRSDPNAAVEGSRRRVAEPESTESELSYPAVSATRNANWLIGYQRRIAITDVVVIILVVFSSQTLRLNQQARLFLDGFGSVSYWLISSILTLLWVAVLAVNGAWDRKILGAGPSEYGRIMRASFYLFGFVAIVSYLAKAEIARSYLAIAVPLGIFGLVGGRWVWRRLLEEYRRNGTHMSAVLVVGGTNSAVALATRLRSARHQPASRSPGCACPVVRSLGVAAVDPSITTLRSSAISTTSPEDREVGADMVAIAASESFGTEEIRRLAWNWRV